MIAVTKRSNNRNDALLDAGAELFSRLGFRETTIRDIANAAGMLPGSVYYHYGSKDDLLLTIYETGVERIIEEFRKAVSSVDEPWERLTAAISAHIGAITRQTPYMRVINRVLPEHVPKHSASLSLLRRRYEECFGELIESLPLAAHIDRSLLRLMILGALNHTQLWFQSNGNLTPNEIGKTFARILIEPMSASLTSATSTNRKTRE